VSRQENEFDFDTETEDEAEEKEQPVEASPYDILVVEPTATPSQIRIAYHRQVREHPPERDPEGFKRIRDAYETLRSPRKRAELALLELRHGPAEFDLDRLRDSPPPPFPERYVEHLLAAALAEVDAAIDAEVARVRQVGMKGLEGAISAPSADGSEGDAR